MQSLKAQATARDYNIITGEPRFFSGSKEPFAKTNSVALPRINNLQRQEFIREKQKDNFKLQDVQPVINSKPFENVVV